MVTRAVGIEAQAKGLGELEEFDDGHVV
jgi:hypothetical protein